MPSQSHLPTLRGETASTSSKYRKQLSALPNPINLTITFLNHQVNPHLYPSNISSSPDPTPPLYPNSDPSNNALFGPKNPLHHLHSCQLCHQFSHVLSVLNRTISPQQDYQSSTGLSVLNRTIHPQQDYQFSPVLSVLNCAISSQLCYQISPVL